MKLLQIDPYSYMFNAHGVKIDRGLIFFEFKFIRDSNYHAPINWYFKTELYNEVIYT
jgi:hypothetical protein